MEQSQNLPQCHVKEHSATAHILHQFQRHDPDCLSHCTSQSPCCTKPLSQHPNIQSCHSMLLVRTKNTAPQVPGKHVEKWRYSSTLCQHWTEVGVTFMPQASSPLWKQPSILIEKGDVSVQSSCGHFGEEKYLSLLPQI
jgi:hypothetical protein